MTNNFDAVLGGLDILTLFFGFYYSTTPIEHYITERELQKRNWRCDLSKKLWFQRKTSMPIQEGDGFEISNFLKFDAQFWSMGDLINFKLNYRDLSPPVWWYSAVCAFFIWLCLSCLLIMVFYLTLIIQLLIIIGLYNWNL